MNYLYAYTKDREGTTVDVALVGMYASYIEANIKKDTEVLCYSDDGLNYSLLKQEIDPPPNTSYDELIERMSK